MVLWTGRSRVLTGGRQRLAPETFVCLTGGQESTWPLVSRAEFASGHAAHFPVRVWELGCPVKFALAAERSVVFKPFKAPRSWCMGPRSRQGLAWMSFWLHGAGWQLGLTGT